MNTVAAAAPASQGRIQFIDALRAFAILMMLQGHFTDTLLSEAYRDTSNVVFNLWFFMRGLTAPIFFTVTGLVFTFLLLKDSRPFAANERVRKGIRRAFFLVFLGYLLRTNLPGLIFQFKLYPNTFMVDVLHIIGLALLSLILLYGIHQRSRIPFPLLLASLGMVLFLFSSAWKKADWSFFPMILENYFTQKNGSVFILYPWIGYTLFGGIIGWHVHRFRALYQTYWWPAVLMALGLLLSFSAATGAEKLPTVTGLRQFETYSVNYYVFWRLGQVLIVVGLFIYIELFFKRFPALFLKVGQETLTIYVVHYFILYGSLTGIGLSRYLYRSLDPSIVIPGAIAFITAHIILIHYIEDIRAIPARLRTRMRAKASRREVTASAAVEEEQAVPRI